MSKFYTSAFLYRNEIHLRGYEDGRRVHRKIPCKPYLFVNSKRDDAVYRTLKGKPVDRVDFDSHGDARDFIKRYENVDGFDVYGLTNYVYTFLNDHYPGDIDYDPRAVATVNIDIEVAADAGFPDPSTAEKEITAITLQINDTYVVLGCGEFKTEDKNVRYIKCEDETKLLLKFLDAWRAINPDVVTGWNIEHFDIPYIVNRIRRILGEHMIKKLSPWEMVEERDIIRPKSIARGGKGIDERVDKVYDIYGVASLDYLELYKKFSFSNQESYRLDYIASVELGVKKLDYSEYGSLLDLYKQNYQKFIEYNIRDVELVKKLDDKLKLIEQVMAIAYDAKVLYPDSMTSVRIWDVIIHNYLLNQRIVIPQKKPGSKDKNIIGAWVKDPLLGMHKWVVSFDLNSLYPHLIMQYNISPETYFGTLGLNEETAVEKIMNGHLDKYREELNANNLACTGSGILFQKDSQGFLPKLMQKMYDDRVVYKRKMLEAKQAHEKNPTYETEKAIAQNHNMQLAKKIQLNSAYGALSNKYFRWYDDALAESITLSGQLSIKWIEREMNKYLNKIFKTEKKDYVIACDTDSMYVTLERLVDQCFTEGDEVGKVVEFLDRACEDRLEPFIESCYEQLGRYVNAYSQKMKMKREAIADKGIWTAKKRCILNVWNNEGVAYTEPKIKLTGIEAVRSSTPQACRESIKKCIKVIIEKDEDAVIKFIDDFYKEFIKLPFDQVAFPRGCKGINKYQLGDSALPIHVRAALLYNNIIKEKKLQNRYEMIKDGDKIKFCYMKKPNPVRENVFACPSEMPPELGLERYIDYDTQYEKAFVEPIKNILDVVGWRVAKQSSLNDFFS
ncbi:PolB DNA polymerase elongation subunit (family B) [uncultured Caudovirales phage]|uniref:DNA polymerase n=1 Tax=uncultured Caudovirales phage TaxID=2100421 RepID=A0A6J7WXL4_9CAUD|nr:PolB DNA polymerase elongation subunit (family B) [uncultured Caudovirales phage]